MEFVIVTGLSGAGKSRAVDALEDIGFYCVDNMPPKLLPKFAELCLQSKETLSRVAIVIDARGGKLFEYLSGSLDELTRLGVSYNLLFLECDDQVLARRYKETRRKHPLMEKGMSMTAAIEKEREMLSGLRDRADFVVDTTGLSAAGLRERLLTLFSGTESGEVFEVIVQSFGFKYGLPQEADLVLDVRCLPNPFYVPELKHKTGLDQEVVDYVMASTDSQELLRRYEHMLEFALPLYVKEGKSQLMIAVGCTGGKHRSITFARKIAAFCEKLGYAPSVQHRDVKRSL